MISFRKILLTLLTFLPISSVVNAAESAILEIAGQEQAKILADQINLSRSLVLPKDSYATSIVEAKMRFKERTGLVDEHIINSELKNHLDLLQKNGILIFDEKSIVAHGPSFAMN